MKKYSELGTVHRTEPCQEYPGKWFLYYPWQLPDEKAKDFPSLSEAILHGELVINQAEEEKREYNPRDVTICWQCSDDDPRVGQVWFTGFYRHGRFNLWGQYVSE